MGAFYPSSIEVIFQGSPFPSLRLLLPDLFDSQPFDCPLLSGLTLDPRNKFPPCKEPVEGLAPLSHALHFDARWDMPEIDTGGGLVNLLPSPSRRSNKLLLNILLLDAKGLHSFEEPAKLFFRDWKKRHQPLISTGIISSSRVPGE
jgi:hypothetical protein